VLGLSGISAVGGRRTRNVNACQGLDHFSAGWEAVVRVLGECPPDDGLFALGERGQVGPAAEMLLRKLEGGPAAKRSIASQHFLVDNRQGVLVGIETGCAAKRFRGGVGGTESCHAPARVQADLADQAEIPDLEPRTDQEQVAGLDIEMLKPELARDEVECFGGVKQ